MRGTVGRRVAGMTGGLWIAVAGPALAQNPPVVDGGSFLQTLEALQGALQAPKSPVLLGIGSGVVAPHGAVFGSVSGTTDRADLDGNGLDGSIAFGVGLGDASRSLGAQVTGVVSSLGTGDTGFGESGSVNLKFSRALTPSTFAGLGVDNLLAWGTEAEEEGIKTTLAVTHFAEVAVAGEPFPLMMTAGYGTHVRADGTEPGAILGLGAGLTEHIGASVSTNTEYLNLGLGVSVPGVKGLSLSATWVDALDQQDRQVGQFAVTYSFNAF